MLETSTGAQGTRSAVPSMSGHVLRERVRLGAAATLDRRERWKLEPLREAVQRHATWIETSVTFPLTWADVVSRHLPESALVVVRRDRAATVRSLIDLGAFTRHRGALDDWIHDPWAVRDGTPPVGPRPDDPESLAAAYVDDVEGRLALIASGWQGQVVEVDLESVADEASAVTALLSELGLEPGPDTGRRTGVVTGRREARRAYVARRLGAAVEAGEQPPRSRAHGPESASRGARIRRIKHLVDLSDPGTDEQVAGALAAVLDAAAHATRRGVDVEILAAGRRTDRVLPDGVRAVGAVVPEGRPRLAELVSALGDAGAADLAVMSGAMTLVRSDLYTTLAALHQAGPDAIAIRSRHLAGALDDPGLATAVGVTAVAPDLFSFDASLVPSLVVGEVVAGDRWAERVLAWNLAQHADELVERGDLTVSTRSDAFRVHLWDVPTAVRSPRAADALAVLERLLLDSPEPAPRPQLVPYLADLGLLG